MKKIVIFVALLMGCSTAAMAQMMGNASMADTVVLSQSLVGDYEQRTILINRPDDMEYKLQYKISASKLTPTLAGNGQALAELESFMQNIHSDTLMRIKRLEVWGYASPDGVVASNKALAAKRAADFSKFLEQKYPWINDHDMIQDSKVYQWKACAAPIESSSLAGRNQALKVIGTTAAQRTKEWQLKQLGTVWNYLRTDILPTLRKVELNVVYQKGVIIDQRKLVKAPTPEPEVIVAIDTDPCRTCVVIEESIEGVVIDMNQE